jgi:hypothetical protein
MDPSGGTLTAECRAMVIKPANGVLCTVTIKAGAYTKA